jgi:DegV family protein with EDD domain
MSEAQKIALNPTLFLKMIFTGGKHIIQSENELNQLNVYPVPDGDTGSNMAALMRYVVAQHYPTDNFGRMLTALADASLIGSCGNSGMILSAFFVGLAKIQHVADKTTLTINEFIDCLASGVKQAHQAVAQPVEGTILTVMQSWVNACMDKRTQVTDFESLFHSTLPIAENALTQTEFLLPALKENHVVDAGAYGFTKLIQGMNKALHDPEQFDVHWEDHETCHDHVAHHNHQTEMSPDSYQYCMETLLSSSHDDLNELREKLAGFCDSIVLNQSPSNIKAHVHTTNVMQCTELLKKYGHIIHQKIDDIKIQWAINEHRKHKIAIVTDSSADIPQHVRDTAQIHTIPMQVRVGEHALIDRLSIDLPTLFSQINSHSTKTMTSAPSVDIVNRYLHFLTSHYDSIIVMTLSSRFSSTFQLIKNQAEHVSRGTGKKIDVVDTHSIASGHGLLVMKAAKLLDQGNDHDQVIQALTKARDNIHVYVVVDELKTMRESGRFSKILHKIADWGQLKPILSMDKTGQMTIASLTLGKQKSWNKIYSLLNKIIKTSNEYTLLISHTTAMETITSFAEQLRGTTGASVIDICETAPSVGVHAGRGAIAVAVYAEAL